MRVRPLTSVDAERIAAWRYPGRYATYDVDEPLTVSSEDFAAIEHDDDLIGYCCFGAPARIDGVDAEDGVLDIGYGMRPDLVGHGLGGEFVGTVLDHARRHHQDGRLRLVILDWNRRSLRVATAHGFEVERAVETDEGRFLVMVSP